MVGRTQAALEVAACLAVAGGYILSKRAGVPVRYVIVFLALAIAGYAAFAVRRGREGPSDFGLRADNLRPSAREVGLFTLVAAAGILFLGWLRGVAIWRPEFLLLLPLYPLYGIGQQILVQGVFHRRLLEVSRSRPVSAVATAAAFGLLHAGNPILFALTTVGGLAWAILYQRHPNLWALGVSHGLLGSLAYPVLLGIDPLSRL